MLLRFAYNILLCLALPFVWLRLFVRARREPAYAERRGERFGRVPAHVGCDVVWFHTVSAGETIGAAPVIRALKARLPEARFLVTTMTPAGSAQVTERLGDIVDHCYAPYDFPWAVRRFVRRVRPRALFLMETELWPNLIAATHATGAPGVADQRAALGTFGARVRPRGPLDAADPGAGRAGHLPVRRHGASVRGPRRAATSAWR